MIQARRENDPSQGCAVGKRLFVDHCDRVRNAYFLQRFAVSKAKCRDGLKAVGNVDPLEALALPEKVITNVLDTGRNDDFF